MSDKVTIFPSDSLAIKVAKRHFASENNLEIVRESAERIKSAGEIRFVKDQGPEERDIPEDFCYKGKFVKPLVRTLWSLSCSMGHLISAQANFTKIKAVNVSPDGRLGGKGYIQKITEMRSDMATAIETVSNIVDTLHDEVNGVHWKPSRDKLPAKDKAEVAELVQDSEDILSDPDAYAAKEYQEEVLDDIKNS